MQALADFFKTGGPFMYVNLFTSIVAIAIIVERAISLVIRHRISAVGLLENIRKLIDANNLARAIKLASASSAPVARVAKAGLAQFHLGEAAIGTAIEETVVDVTPELKKRIGSLWSLANIATLLGLIGTIFGLIKTFSGLGAANPEDRARMLSDGIAEAMNNTALGLAIAVTCMVGHLLLSGVSRKHLSDLDAFALKLENCLTDGVRKAASGQRPGEGHR